jgi:hypothetical protein
MSGESVYYGKCSRCEMVKKDYEVVPQPYDLLLCKMCYKQVQRDALRGHDIQQINETLNQLLRKQPVDPQLDYLQLKTHLGNLRHDIMKLI